MTIGGKHFGNSLKGEEDHQPKDGMQVIPCHQVAFHSLQRHFLCITFSDPLRSPVGCTRQHHRHIFFPPSYMVRASPICGLFSLISKMMGLDKNQTWRATLEICRPTWAWKGLSFSQHMSSNFLKFNTSGGSLSQLQCFLLS